MTAKPQVEIRLRHLGGEERMVVVTDADESGTLYVRWPGAGIYAVRLFYSPHGLESPGWMFAKATGRFPSQWRCSDLESARQVWRVRTGRQEPKEKK